MGRPRAYDRDAALLAARDLFWEQGYERTSIADLEERTGLNRSSLYQEFGSKQKLFEASLQCYADRVISGLLAGLRGGTGTGPPPEGSQPAGAGLTAETGLAAVAALFRRVAELCRCDAAVSTRGCMMVNATAELAAHDAGVRAHATAYRDRLRADFGAALSRAAASGEIAPDTVRVPRRAACLGPDGRLALRAHRSRRRGRPVRDDRQGGRVLADRPAPVTAARAMFAGPLALRYTRPPAIIEPFGSE